MLRSSLVVALLLIGGEAVAGGPCKTGCSVATLDETGLSDGQIESLLAKIKAAPRVLDETNEELETVLFHSKSVRNYLGRHGIVSLGRNTALLTEELQRDRAVIELKMVDESGRQWVHFEPQTVELGHKVHLTASKTAGVPAPIFSGTVVRVGLKHIWSRL